MRTRILATLSLAALVGLAVPGAAAPPEPAEPSCVKERGTWTCTTVEGPGNNQAGVGSTTEDQTQGNMTNKSPEEPQDLSTDECTGQKPEKAQGDPIAC